MASYPTTIVQGNKYIGEFPEISEPITVLLNGANAPCVITALPGGGFKVIISGGDVQVPSGQTTGSIVVSDASHSFTTTITR